MTKKGKFIVIEGLDGAGSSTQSVRLNENLNNMGIKSILTKEPTNNLVGGLIRGFLTRSWKLPMEGMQLLYSADRSHHLEREILPNLIKGNHVVCDRYLFSTIAFGSLELDKKWLMSLGKYFPVPDITFYLKVKPENCIKRINKSRGEREYFEEVKKLRKVHTSYLSLARDKKNKIHQIDGEKSIEIVEKQILNIVNDLIVGL